MAATVEYVLKSSLIRLGILAPGESMSDSTKEEALNALNNMLETWQNDDGLAVTERALFSTVSGLAYVTLNPVPAKIIAVTLRDGQDDIRLVRISDLEYMAACDKVARSTPRQYYHDNDNLYLLSIPDAVYPVTVLYNSAFPVYDDADSIDLPAGYVPAIIDNLAIELSPTYPGVNVSEFTIVNARKLKGQLRRKNRRTPQGVRFNNITAGGGHYNIETDSFR